MGFGGVPSSEAGQATAVASWRFVPRPERGVPAPEELAFRSSLTSALRAGQGLGVEVGVSVGSGPDPPLTAWASTPQSARWMTRVLAPVYGAHQWVPSTRPRTVDCHAPSRRTARRLAPWPEMVGSSTAGSGVLDALVVVLSALPPGVSLAWSWRSVPLGRPRLWKGSSPVSAVASPPTRVPSGSVPLPERRVDPATLSTQRPLFGRLQMTLDFGWESPALGQERRVASALEAATASERGNRLVFRPSRGTLGRRLVRDGGIWLSVEEWERFWPRPWCAALGEPEEPSGRTWVLPLGRTGTGAVVGPQIEPRQGRHLAVLGETGMGKSSLLVAVAHRAFREGGGVVFDPLGETARSLREELPPEVRRRVVWIAPEAGAVGVNALEGVGAGSESDPIRSERRLNDLVHALRRVRSGRYEESSYWGPRLEEMVTRALRAAAALPRGTLADAHTLLATSARLGRPIPDSAIEAVRELADRIRERPEDADGARRLLHEVVRSPVLLRMLCEPEPRRSTRDLVAPGRVVLISGDAAVVGEATARYLLSVYLALVWSELLAREGGPKTFVVLDEAQWFSHESLGEMLRLGRRRNVHVLLATQAVGSLPTGVGEAVWTNVSDFVAFRGSPGEAREFSRASRSVSAEELLALPRGSAAVLLGKGHVVRWVRTARRPAFASSPPAHEIRGSDSPPPATQEGVPTDGAGSGQRDPDPAAGVLAALVRRADRLDVGVALVVTLEELRQEVDPTGEGVRRAGSMLGRLGLLTRSDSGLTGARWTIAPEHLAGLRSVAFPASPGPSPPPQPS